MNVLCIGDIVGKPGRTAVYQLLPALKQEYKLDFVIANAENAAGGAGLDIGRSVVLDAQGRIVVAGHSMSAEGNFDLVVWRYR